jgi:hypothetical protein
LLLQLHSLHLTRQQRLFVDLRRLSLPLPPPAQFGTPLCNGRLLLLSLLTKFDETTQLRPHDEVDQRVLDLPLLRRRKPTRMLGEQASSAGGGVTRGGAERRTPRASL